MLLSRQLSWKTRSQFWADCKPFDYGVKQVLGTPHKCDYIDNLLHGQNLFSYMEVTQKHLLNKWCADFCIQTREGADQAKQELHGKFLEFDK